VTLFPKRIVSTGSRGALRAFGEAPPGANSIADRSRIIQEYHSVRRARVSARRQRGNYAFLRMRDQRAPGVGGNVDLRGEHCRFCRFSMVCRGMRRTGPGFQAGLSGLSLAQGGKSGKIGGKNGKIAARMWQT